jgi:hypothetical protein
MDIMMTPRAAGYPVILSRKEAIGFFQVGFLQVCFHRIFFACAVVAKDWQL